MAATAGSLTEDGLREALMALAEVRDGMRADAAGDLRSALGTVASVASDEHGYRELIAGDRIDDRYLRLAMSGTRCLIAEALADTEGEDNARLASVEARNFLRAIDGDILGGLERYGVKAT